MIARSSTCYSRGYQKKNNADKSFEHFLQIKYTKDLIMDQNNEIPFEFSEAKIKSLKEKYSREMRDHDDNPIKVCMKLD